MSSLFFNAGDKIVMIGDSITDSGRRGEPHAPYGAGYVSMVRSFVIGRYPGLGLEFVNRGIGGDTVRDLDARWQADVIDERPDVLTVKIGINDIWRCIGAQPAAAVGVEEYEATYRRLLQAARDATGCRLMLIDPYVIETDPEDPFRKMMDVYIERVHAIAADFGALSVHTQAAFDRALAEQPAEFWAGDRVHPCPPGHAVIAMAVLRAVGFEL